MARLASLYRSALPVLLCAALLLTAVDRLSSSVQYEKLRSTIVGEYGDRGTQAIDSWQAMLERTAGLSEQQKLTFVNDFFNQNVNFDDDIFVWGQEDYWATPAESLSIRAGDCDDFSIAKYVSLVLSGVSVEKLRITYVKAQLSPGFTQAHMVLAYYATPSGEPVILDNINRTILPASQRSDLAPVFSFNSGGIWVGGSATPNDRQPEARLSRWREVITRLNQQGITL